MGENVINFLIAGIAVLLCIITVGSGFVLSVVTNIHNTGGNGSVIPSESIATR